MVKLRTNEPVVNLGRHNPQNHPQEHSHVRHMVSQTDGLTGTLHITA